MRIRNRLFLVIGIIFLIAFGASYFLEDIIPEKKMRLIDLGAFILVLFFLHMASARITRPISIIAGATEKVAMGQLEDIELPKNSKDKEIQELCESFEKMIQGLKYKEKMKGVLNKVVSPEIAKEILKGSIHLGGEEKRVTVLFGDIRHFTALSSKMAPHDVIEMLNACMTRVTRVIEEFGGVIDKYVGDEVMALYGAPIDQEESALKAIMSGLKMVQVLNAWNIERQKQGLENIEMGIGIHTGIVLAGNMGAEDRLNYTVIGSGVNLGARLCSIAKGMQILISEHTLQEPGVHAKVEVELLPPVVLKGFEEKVPVYAVKGLHEFS